MSNIVNYPRAYDEVSHSGLNTTTWTSPDNILQSTDTFAVGSYRDGKVPQQLYLYDFNLDLVESQVIKSITFEVKLSCSNGVTVPAPSCFVNQGKAFSHSDTSYPNSIRVENNNLVSTYGNVYSYTVDWSELFRHDVDTNALNTDIFGVVLQFKENQASTNGYIYVEWVRCNVEYEQATYTFGAEPPFATRDWEAVTFSTVYKKGICRLPFYASISLHKSPLTSKGGTLKVDLPDGLRIDDASCTNCTWDGNTKTLNDLFKNDGSNAVYVQFTFTGTTNGYKEITFHGDGIGSWTYLLYIQKNSQITTESDEQVEITTNTCRKGAESIITVDARTYNSDGTASFEVGLPNQNAPYSIVPDMEHCDSEVSFSDVNLSNGQITFNVPKDKYVTVSFDIYFIPANVGVYTVEITAVDNSDLYTYDYTVEQPYFYVFNFNCKDTLVEGGRLVSTVDTGAYILPCRTVDDVVKVKKPTLAVKHFEDIDYIGCVKLKQTHYKPKSTFKDTLLNTTYKNKKYMGKKGAVDEDITLQVRLPPVDVTTVQGMVEMDKPIPINTNHLCFEGDALNHRGWAEIYSIKTDRVGNNPLWYDCDIDVKYITHNISSRFKINKGSRVSDYFLPNLLTPRFESGGDMGDAFYSSTTGTLGYNGDNVDVNRRNISVLDEGEYVKLRSQEPLNIKCKAILDWTSTVNTETRDNHVSRIFRLIDKNTGNAVFEYEYYDFTHDGEDHSCRVIGRLLYKDAYKVVINRKINLYHDTTEDNSGTPLFGSELEFRLMSNILTIQDGGWSGKELLLEDITLTNGEYYLEVEVQNNNSDLDASPIIHYFNYQLLDLMITTEYNPYYENLLVSPFPVPNRNIIYTRDSEDGTIFFLEDDGTECSYNLSPYYQYHTGVSLESLEGIQLINLENNHNTLYITNGLIRVGVNRLNGKLTLYKYDRVSGQYILVSNLQLTKYDDMNINNFTDDKIEFQISDTVLTVWRGRPFVRVSHPTEDINFNDKYVRIYAEKVGDSTSAYPTDYELVDDTNLFPVCVGSKRLIKSECIGTSTEEFTPSTTNLSLELLDTDNNNVSSIGISQPCRFHVWSGNLNPIEEVSFVVDGEMIPAKVYLDTALYEDGQAPNYIEYTFDEIGEHTVQAIWTEVDGYDYALSSELTINVFDDTYNLTPQFGDELYFDEGSFDFLLTYGGSPAPKGKVVNITANGMDYPRATDSNGVVSLGNHLLPNEYIITANFCKAISDVDPEEYDPSQITVIDARASKSVKIKKAYTQVEVLDKNGTSITKTSVVKGEYVNCKLSDTQGNSLANDVITITVNGVSYTRVTDSDGLARLNINLMANTYDLQVSFIGTDKYEPVVKNFELIVVD